EPPEDVLGPVAADPEVGRLARGVVASPDVLAGPLPALRDRVAEEEDADVALPGLLQEPFVLLGPGTRAGLGGDRAVGRFRGIVERPGDDRQADHGEGD